MARGGLQYATGKSLSDTLDGRRGSVPEGSSREIYVTVFSGDPRQDDFARCRGASTMTKSPSGWIRVGKSLAGGENASLRSAGDLPRTETKTMKNGNLLAVQEAMVRRIVSG